MSHLFVSYSRRDTARVDDIVAALHADGHEVWVDRTALRLGERWRNKVAEAIVEAKACLIMISPPSVQSKTVGLELELASSHGKLIFPILLEPTTLPSGLQLIIGGTNYVKGDLFESDRQKFLAQFADYRERVPGAPPPAKPKAKWYQLEWSSPGILFPTSSLVAGAGVFGSSTFTEPLSHVPAALSAPMSLPLVGVPALVGLATLAGGILLTAARLISPAAGGLVAFSLVTGSVSVLNHGYVAAVMAMAAVMFVAIWRWRHRGMSLSFKNSIAQALVLAGLVWVGATADYWRRLQPPPTPVIGVAALEAAHDPRADYSNTLGQKLSAALSGAGFGVQPASFEPDQLRDWSFDRWLSAKGQQIRPTLLVKNSLDICGPDIYVWLSEPYKPDFTTPAFGALDLHQPIRKTGTDPRTMATAVAFDVFSVSRDYLGLDAAAQQRVRHTFLNDLLSIARTRQLDDEIATIDAMLQQPTLADQDVTAVIQRLLPTDGACDEAGHTNRSAQRLRIKALLKP